MVYLSSKFLDVTSSIIENFSNHKRCSSSNDQYYIISLIEKEDFGLSTHGVNAYICVAVVVTIIYYAILPVIAKNKLFCPFQHTRCVQKLCNDQYYISLLFNMK